MLFMPILSSLINLISECLFFNVEASWETNADCSEYTLKVREGVKFSDGTSLTAEILKYSLEAWAPYRDGSFMYSLDSINVVDDLTLIVKLSKGYGNLPIEMSRLYVSLPDSLDDKGNVVNWVGTGTFILDDYQLEQSALLKSCILENMDSRYVMTARAKGLKESMVLVRHVLKNVMLPVITLTGMNMTSMLGGSVIIESIFGLPGLGGYLVTAINVKDFPVIMGFTFIIGIIVVVINLLVDLSYALIDPRVRQGINEK
jgi:hypothetical protein